MEIVRPEMTFEELYYQMNEFIQTEGYINLDFMGNLGHSIVRKKEDRIYIEKGNRAKLADVSLFTFEPHISVSGSKYGYKRENIYYFDKEGLKELYCQYHISIDTFLALLFAYCESVGHEIIYESRIAMGMSGYSTKGYTGFLSRLLDNAMKEHF